MAEDQEKLSTHFGVLADVVREAHFWARQAGARGADGRFPGGVASTTE
ncbi:MAG TPA: Lon-insertion domain-containing protein [Candidatus Tectomicrobia bacterium]|nr:Lon-insertion domain-containing protein [Candidatus Tectomicrobia bacterium]